MGARARPASRGDDSYFDVKYDFSIHHKRFFQASAVAPSSTVMVAALACWAVRARKSISVAMGRKRLMRSFVVGVIGIHLEVLLLDLLVFTVFTGIYSFEELFESSIFNLSFPSHSVFSLHNPDIFELIFCPCVSTEEVRDPKKVL